MITYEKRVTPDTWEDILPENIVYADYIRTTDDEGPVVTEGYWFSGMPSGIVYQRRVTTNPDAWEPVDEGNIVYGDYIAHYVKRRLRRKEAWQRNKPVVTLKNVYTGPQFWKALRAAERILLVAKSKETDAAGAIFEGIKLGGLDFNESDDVTIVGQMVNVGILSSARRNTLIG